VASSRSVVHMGKKNRSGSVGAGELAEAVVYDDGPGSTEIQTN